MGTGMRSIASGFALAALLGVVFTTPAAAEFFGCNDKKTSVRMLPSAGHFASAGTTREFAAQSSRPRITVHPRKVGRNSVRQCRAQLVKEHRASGTVIVPRTQCWWE